VKTIAMTVLLVPLALTTAGAQGRLLGTGTRLWYSSDGKEGDPWTVERIVHDTTLGGLDRCAVIQLRTSPSQTTPEIRTWCVRSDSLFAWDAAQQSHRLLRPVGANMTVTIPSPRGGSATYTTGTMEEWRYADDAISIGTRVLPTEVVSRDSTGRVIRRLREHYALSLATAVSGVFEVPDSARTSGWREERAFTLTRVGR
jgi:hypothetical protein